MLLRNLVLSGLTHSCHNLPPSLQFPKNPSAHGLWNQPVSLHASPLSSASLSEPHACCSGLAHLTHFYFAHRSVGASLSQHGVNPLGEPSLGLTHPCPQYHPVLGGALWSPPKMAIIECLSPYPFSDKLLLILRIQCPLLTYLR